ncbi:MAG: histidinol phosphate phosphatase [Nitrospirales bacterium]|nr:histidinol phosphate phosphatase [Nitrospirales bacterium]
MNARPLLDPPTLQSLLKTAVRAARMAAPQILQRFRQGSLSVEDKSDGSPVTIADREAETTIRNILQDTEYPCAIDILGEEHGLEGIGTRLRWLVDPIDGTRSFINGIPLFGTIVALEDTREQRALVGVIHLPVLDMTYAAGRGLGTTCNGTPVHVMPYATIETAMVAVGDPAQFATANQGQAYRQLQTLCPYLRGYTDCFGHTLVINGAIGAMLDPSLNPWDVQATQVLVEEAGGTMLLRPSAMFNKVDALFGNPKMVAFLAQALSF